jgi:hypothetical protein
LASDTATIATPKVAVVAGLANINHAVATPGRPRIHDTQKNPDLLPGTPGAQIVAASTSTVPCPSWPRWRQGTVGTADATIALRRGVCIGTVRRRRTAQAKQCSRTATEQNEAPNRLILFHPIQGSTSVQLQLRSHRRLFAESPHGVTAITGVGLRNVRGRGWC